MATHGWAQCTDKLADVLRRGAWYPIVEELPNGMVALEVQRNRVELKRSDLRIRHDPPSSWSIVVRTGVMRPTWSGTNSTGSTTYAVCPSCAERQYLEGKPLSLQCGRCRKTAPVDWNETC
jgi:hypothetical protein